MARDWQSLQDNLAKVLSTIRLEQFVIVEYDADLADLQPYGQTARGPDGYYCEIVSECFLPRQAWPILPGFLARDGWQEPYAPDENWWCDLGDDPRVAAETLLAGLRQGRVCRDPSRFSWHVGTFPPGPDGGEPVPVPITSQRRAA